MPTRIRVRDNGPLVVDADDVTIVDEAGGKFVPGGRTAALCRCGGSSNKPFCDGSHRVQGFEAADRGASPE